MQQEFKRIFLEDVELPEKLLDKVDQFKETMMMYNCAIRSIRTKLEVLNDELSLTNNRNPIEFIKTRIKKPRSIVNKLNRKGLDISLTSIVESLNDVAGIRVVCSFIDDIYSISDMLTRQDDIKLIEIKDYIKNPKPNGYRSLHLIVEIPVFFSDRTLPLKAEIQIRTIGMDFWASLEHKLKYKNNIDISEVISEELEKCSAIISDADLIMQKIKHDVDNIS
ncbi:GTP pyrophosphokinase family protein [Clostridium sp. DSM 100503]|uniref:GTP pyrophosphokinase n=1 Tax=Clostridium sp. DSM 100503 TaxID=2963282 RepID=UPI002149D4EF|nr:GTP pyrophosphokinase family protein [Clostridium sp. DSM 100503]MCR1952714.1 GTP pyrophosphokinase family protein [Clostridium sp. DSM 100503]